MGMGAEYIYDHMYELEIGTEKRERKLSNMSILKTAQPLTKAATGRLWTVYGKSGAGKTAFCGTFPKPMLYCQFGDDGRATLGIDSEIHFIEIADITMFKELITELREVSKLPYKTIVVDTFSLIVQEWTDKNSTRKGWKMTQQMWGELGADTNEAIRVLKEISKRCDVVLTCHEIVENIEGMENEIIPSVVPNVSPMSRPYLRSMSNMGVHIAVLSKTIAKDGKEITRQKHVAQLMPNSFYWTKVQKPPEVVLPVNIVDPTYDKIMGYLAQK